MELSEIKKELYKKQPHANLWQIRNKIAYYIASLDKEGNNVFFEVPINDMGTAAFTPKMEAKHLIRWIVQHDT